MILELNTSDRELVKIALKNETILDLLEERNKFGSQALLPLIIQLLKKNSLEFKDLTSIEVNTGPGSYTGLKVGAAIANALGFSLGIPVNGKKQETELQYE